MAGVWLDHAATPETPARGAGAATDGAPAHAGATWRTGRPAASAPDGAIASLDGVRAIACLTVMGYHINLATSRSHIWPRGALPLVSAVLLSGGAGVTLFFVLSGFLLFLPFARALLCARAWPATGLFYLRRALRILPAYYVSLVLLVAFTQPQYWQPRRWGDLLLFVALLQDSTPSTFRAINGPYWTLSIEWQFYLLLPLLAWGVGLVARRVRPARRLPVVAGCLVGLAGWGVLSRWFGDYFAAHPTATLLVPRPALNVALWLTYGSAGKYLEDFAVGMLVCVVYVAVRAPAGASAPGAAGAHARRARRLGPWLWGAGLSLLLAMALWIYALTYHYTWPVLGALFPSNGTLNELGFALGYGCCVLAVLLGGGRAARLLARAPLRGLGHVSYSLYIWHLPVLGFFMGHVLPAFGTLPPAATYALYWLWALAVIIPFAAASYWLVERPGMRWSDRLRARWRARRADAREGVAPARVAERAAPAS
ncbi:MAG TPA: acyltransferase [Ktedonobacterales bacterium]